MMNYHTTEPLFGDFLDDSGSLYWDGDSELKSLLSDVNQSTLPQNYDDSHNIVLDTNTTNGNNQFLLDNILNENFLNSFTSIQSVGSPSGSSSGSLSDVTSPCSPPNSIDSTISPLSSSQSTDDWFELHDLLEHPTSNVSIEPTAENTRIEIPLTTIEDCDFINFNGINVLVVDNQGQQSIQPLKVSPKEDNIDEVVAITSTPTTKGKSTKLKTLSVTDRKKRKRDQNKNAATRYREKRRLEEDKLKGELDSLSSRNKELQDNELQITREIQYLKDLLLEVYRTKGYLE